MRIIKHTDADYAESVRQLVERPPFDLAIERSVADILAGVRTRGDQALCEYAKTFDGADLTPANFRVSEAEMAAAAEATPPEVREAIRQADAQIRAFSRNRIPRPWSCTPRAGVTLGERFTPMSRVACYVPGGTAPLVSTVLHTVSLATVAGVEDVVVVTPPGRDGSVNPAILFAARTAGASTVYRLGGVYAIAALAFGTETIPKAEKIVGPGNAYVTAAKRQVYGYVSLDMVAGPSEIMVLADDTARPDFIAADMLSQIEHGSGRESAVLATPSAPLLAAVEKELRRQARDRRRAACIETCLAEGTFLVLVENLAAAAALASAYAPEHLEIMTRDPAELAQSITAAGAIFLGPWTPEPVGDFVAGPSHVLPTGGAARFFSGLTVDQFFRRMSVVDYDQTALAREVDMIATFADTEGLDAHGHSARLRAAPSDR